jgi:2',3'-cyclic-nucleotide 2'-phosphodiesterase (5'-nucleotidase family)
VAGIQYTWDYAKPDGQRIVSLTLPDGKPLDAGATYKVVVNSFMATGGDDLAVLKELAGQQTDLYVIDLDVAVAYFQQVTADKPLSYSLQDRVTVLNLPK